MPELGSSGSARGAVSDHRPYRDLMHRSKLYAASSDIAGSRLGVEDDKPGE